MFHWGTPKCSLTVLTPEVLEGNCGKRRRSNKLSYGNRCHELYAGKAACFNPSCSQPLSLYPDAILNIPRKCFEDGFNAKTGMRGDVEGTETSLRPTCLGLLVKIQLPRLGQQLEGGCRPCHLTSRESTPLHIGLGPRHNLWPCHKSETEPTVVQSLSHSLDWSSHLDISFTRRFQIIHIYTLTVLTNIQELDDKLTRYPHTKISSTLTVNGTKLRVPLQWLALQFLLVKRFRVSVLSQTPVVLTDAFHSLS
jgi:hypothetical protein